jgi:hypothetical protein
MCRWTSRRRSADCERSPKRGGRTYLIDTAVPCDLDHTAFRDWDSALFRQVVAIEDDNLALFAAALGDRQAGENGTVIGRKDDVCLGIGVG